MKNKKKQLPRSQNNPEGIVGLTAELGANKTLIWTSCISYEITVSQEAEDAGGGISQKALEWPQTRCKASLQEPQGGRRPVRGLSRPWITDS